MEKGKSSELERAYRKRRKGFQAWATKTTRNIADAEDLVQDAFASALANADSLIDADDLAAWLFTSLRNKARDLWRRRETRRNAGEADLSDEVLAEIVAASELDPADIAEGVELAEALDAAIGELPDAQRAVIEAQVLDGLTFREIAEETGISADTLAARKRYAIKRLAESLKEWFA